MLPSSIDVVEMNDGKPEPGSQMDVDSTTQKPGKDEQALYTYRNLRVSITQRLYIYIYICIHIHQLCAVSN
jgi:hypothetical protein